MNAESRPWWCSGDPLVGTKIRALPPIAPRGVTSRWSGGFRDAAQRQQERRTRLIQAGLDLFGTVGYASVSVKQACSHAGLTERYFYESFRDREDLLTGVYNELIATIRAETAQAAAAAAPDVDAQLRAGLEVFIRTLAGDARMARVVLIEVVAPAPASKYGAVRSCTSSPH
ncbi:MULTISPECIES: TetR/AcrR family transcriptional regulator [Streptomyces]|uniref:TetR/AcrR family transcriptional regulator n=1 Tax=Streptomyces TaxID=1883 RepID=UPI0033ACAC10